MKLYFSPAACSLAPHICLHEAGLAHTAEKVDMRKREVSDGRSYRSVNPKGYVPALELDDGQVLTEVAAIVQYIADLAPGSGLAPPPGDMARYRMQEWLSFIGTELHKGFGPLVRPGAPEEFRASARNKLEGRLQLVAAELDSRDFLLGDRFSAADSYLYTVLSWAPFAKLDLSTWPRLERYVSEIGARPAVQAARKAEGLPA
ncbi:MAG: glutathione transferase GstA [Chromatiales bacterium]|nr:glutathione transferase GstA [Chromatiales bacterium]